MFRSQQRIREEAQTAALATVDEILLRWEHAEAALDLALRLCKSWLGPAEAERRLQAWAEEREAEGGVERPYTPAENKLLTVARALRGEP